MNLNLVIPFIFIWAMMRIFVPNSNFHSDRETILHYHQYPKNSCTLIWVWIRFYILRGRIEVCFIFFCLIVFSTIRQSVQYTQELIMARRRFCITQRHIWMVSLTTVLLGTWSSSITEMTAPQTLRKWMIIQTFASNDSCSQLKLTLVVTILYGRTVFCIAGRSCLIKVIPGEKQSEAQLPCR